MSSSAQTGGRLSPTEIFSGRSIFLLGSTGFVGKVTLSMLLSRFPGIGRVYVMVRSGSGTTSEQRFWRQVVTSPTFDPLRERYGSALEGFLRDKVRVVGGDIVDPDFGYTPEEAQAIADDIDVLVNSSGKVTFNPPLEQSLRTNVQGTKNVLAFARRMKRPALVHVSTCFVAGNRSNEVWEDEPLDGYFPRHEELGDTRFDVEKEILECEKLSARVRDEASDTVLTAELTQRARERLENESRDADDERALRHAVALERKNWVRDRLTKLGIERAHRWGWPNIYTYAKSMGDQLVARAEGIVRTIVRPSIVESALRYPFPGWNEGFTTTAPVIFLTLKGQNMLPCTGKLLLDVTPCDYISAGMLLAAAQCMVEDDPPIVYQLATSDTNPYRMDRVVTLTGLYKRKWYEEREGGSKLWNELAARMEVQPVARDVYDRLSLPRLNQATRGVQSLLDRVRPRWGGGRITQIIDQVQEKLDRVEQVTRETTEGFDMFRPFISDNEYVFRADHMRALAARVPEEERHLVPWDPETIDWYSYWLDVHCPGLEKWVFPDLEEDFKPPRQAVYTYKDLLELFETTTKHHAQRTAMRMERDGREERYSYADLRELALRAAGFLAERGVAAGERVALYCENCPEWGMSYFGVLRGGATCIPIDHQASVAEVCNLAVAGKARGVIVGREKLEQHPEIAERLEALGVPCWPVADVFALTDESAETRRLALLPKGVKSDQIASLIFTSGTTGRPKGVMLSHRNFSSMVGRLAEVFSLSSRDGVLSVLPLHHTFEFSTGFLLPLSRGAQIAYLPELTGDAITKVLEKGRTSAIVGVPALWELLRRRITQRFSDRSPRLREVMDAFGRFNSWLRDQTPFNLGRLLFLPVHERFGGRIRYLISGGAALSADIARAFHGYGFRMLEGYGLTEASPVITVTRPQNALLRGAVGQAIPGVEVRILEPDAAGVGEVLARGPNIMEGYFDDAEATRLVLRDGWLYTGDLGRLDDEGNLFLVGRSKDVIIDGNGKNVYPDEIEEIYLARSGAGTDAELVKELSVVGLPEESGPGERVACLVVPDYEKAAETLGDHAGREEVRRRIDEHFRNVSLGLPFPKRIKVHHYVDGELPRTATKKVKRRDVLEALRRFERAQQVGSGVAPAAREGDDWLCDVVAQVSGKARARVTLGARLSELGFDSLMYTELGVALEAAGAEVPSPDELVSVQTVADLLRVVRRGAARPVKATQVAEDEPAADREIDVPAPMQEVGKRLIDAGRRLIYGRAFDVEVRGQDHIPWHTNFVVAPNHASHADIGLVKHALGDAGKDLAALAASDYFFDDRYKRAFFESFTELVPMDRSGSLRKSLERAENVLNGGRSLLIFPEGTRSSDGTMTEFKPSLGYLSLRTRTGILPMYLRGTYDMLPKGKWFIQSMKLGAVFGPFLDATRLESLVEGLPRPEHYRAIALYVQRIVESLRDGTRPPLDVAAFKRTYQAEAEA